MKKMKQYETTSRNDIEELTQTNHKNTAAIPNSFF